jgi:V/A-type H+-transporting ATPase subunit I
MILKMARVQIWGMKDTLDRVIPVLHNFGRLHIDDVHDVPDALIQPLELSESLQSGQEEVTLLIAGINGLIELFSRLKKSKQEISLLVEEDFVTIKSRVADITSQVQYLNNQRKTLQDELVSLSKYNDMLRVIAPVMPESSKRSGNASLRALVHSSQMREMNLLAQQLRLLTKGKFEMVSVKVGEATTAVIGIFPFEMMAQIEIFMKNEKITQLILPEEYAYLSTDDALAHIVKKIELNHQELDEIDSRFKRMAETWLMKLKTWQLVCKDRLDEFEAFTKVGETEYTFTIFGWVTVDDLGSLEDLLKKTFGKKVLMNVIDVPESLAEKIPVALSNPEALTPFEDFVKMRAVPKYSDIDPSTLVAIFMPLFFGMMVGDAGYGVLMFLLSIIMLRKPIKGLIGDFLKALRIGSIWTVLFGVLYGEYFGSLGEKIGLKPLWFSRSAPSSITTLMIMALTVGVSHILLGLMIGVWNALVHRSRSEAFERLGMAIGLVGIVFLAASLTTNLPHGYTLLGWIILAVGLVTLALSLGKIGFFLGPIEFVGVIGNILSYLRIAALGLASVFLAKVANDMGSMVGSAFVGVIIAIVIHSLNLVMGMLSPTIQSLRLQYVEFFRKFYEGGQSSFMPFRKRVVAAGKISGSK